MRIGKLAKMANCTAETIRYYEQQGLLPPPSRTDANYRIYNKSHLDRLKFIRNCRSLDMNHEEIRELLELLDKPETDCTLVSNVLDQHLNHIIARITELQDLRLQLTNLSERCHGSSSVNHCSIVQELTDKDMTTNLHKTHLG